MDDEVSLGDLLEGGAEGVDKLVRQVPDESDRVRDRVRAPPGRRGAPDGRVQGREQRILDQHPGPGEPVEQRGLAGVRVAGDHHGRDCVGPAGGALGGPCGAHLLQLPAQPRHPCPDPATVGLDLRLAGAACADPPATGDPSARLPRHGLAPTTQPGEHVLHLGERDLGLALLALGVLSEDVEDERRPVDHLDLDDVLEVDQLGGAELPVTDEGVGADVEDDVAQLAGLAGPDVGGGIGPVAPLDTCVQHDGPGRLRQRGELDQGVLGVGQAALRPDADEHDALQAQPAVLDLGDVGQLGGQARHPAQRVTIRQVGLPGVAESVRRVSHGVGQVWGRSRGPGGVR